MPNRMSANVAVLPSSIRTDAFGVQTRRLTEPGQQSVCIKCLQEINILLRNLIIIGIGYIHSSQFKIFHTLHFRNRQYIEIKRNLLTHFSSGYRGSECNSLIRFSDCRACHSTGWCNYTFIAAFPFNLTSIHTHIQKIQLTCCQLAFFQVLLKFSDICRHAVFVRHL